MEDQPALKFISPGEEFALLLLWKPLSSLLTPHWSQSKLCNVLLPPAESLPIISGESSCWRQLGGDFYDYYSSCKVICAVVALGCLSVSVTNTSFNVEMVCRQPGEPTAPQPSQVSREGQLQGAGTRWKMQETLLGRSWKEVLHVKGGHSWGRDNPEGPQPSHTGLSDSPEGLPDPQGRAGVLPRDWR